VTIKKIHPLATSLHKFYVTSQTWLHTPVSQSQKVTWKRLPRTGPTPKSQTGGDLCYKISSLAIDDQNELPKKHRPVSQVDKETNLILAMAVLALPIPMSLLCWNCHELRNLQTI